MRALWIASALALLASCPTPARALWINELYFDPPGSLDSVAEYIELRGDALAPLTNHYLVILESEGSEEVGTIDNIFDLGGFELGANGFLTLRQKGSPYQVHPDASDYVNDGPNLPPFGTSPGFGSGAQSTIGASDVGGEGITENGAFSALLIRNDGGAAPGLGDDLDTNNDGQMDVPTGKTGWTILDSVGQSEPGEDSAKFYAAINFQRAGNTGATVQAGGRIVNVPFEIEYLGRWGNSTGATEADWHVSNLTDDNGSGFQNVADYRQSRSDPHPPSDGDISTPAPQAGSLIETSKGVPYGTILTGTLGAPNYITGDFNGDGVVNAADYTVWRDALGSTGTELAHPAADANHDFVVDAADYELWRANYGAPFAGSLMAQAPTQAPEPTALAIAVALLALSPRRRRVRGWRVRLD